MANASINCTNHQLFVHVGPVLRIVPLLPNRSRTAMETIRIRGARTHNLKNINLDLPRDQLIVITGLSGSGKSSLAFDTL